MKFAVLLSCLLLAHTACAFDFGFLPKGAQVHSNPNKAVHPIEADAEAVWDYVPEYVRATRHLAGAEGLQAMTSHPSYINEFGMVNQADITPSATCSSHTNCASCAADSSCKWHFFGCSDANAIVYFAPECTYGVNQTYPTCSSVCTLDTAADIKGTAVGNTTTQYSRVELKYLPSQFSGVVSTASIMSSLGFNMFFLAISGGSSNIQEGPPAAYIQAGFMVNRPGSATARGAWFMIMAESTYKFTISGNPNGVDSSGATSLQLNSGAKLTVYSIAQVPGGTADQKYVTIVYSNVNNGGNFETKCYMTNAKITIGSTTLQPYDMKCDVNLKSLSASAGQGWGIRFITLASSLSASIASDSNGDEDLAIGSAGSFTWNTTAAVAGSLVPIKVKGPTDCGTLTWLTPAAQAQLANLGFPTFRCLFFSFMSDNPSELLWDPETKIDPAKAEAAALSPAAINAPSMFVALGFAALSTLLARLH